MAKCVIIGDVVRRAVQSVQEDRCTGQGGDFDEDNVCQGQDNCDAISNQDQTDSDGDGTGDACECSARTMQDQDTDGIDDCVDACLLPTSTFGPFVPSIAASNCGCQPVALVGQGQLRRWQGGPGVTGVPHLDGLRCNFSADSPPTEGPFLLRDVTRQAVNAVLPGHVHAGLLSSGFSAVMSQEMVTKIRSNPSAPAEIVTADTMAAYSQPPTLENRAAIDAQIGAQMFYDFLRTIPGASGRPLVSIQDPLPGPMASMISHINEPGNESNSDLAFVGSDGSNFFVGYPSLGGRYASAALDVVGHEWFHAFTRFANLRGVPLAGRDNSPVKAKAAEEGFADAIGVSFEMMIAGQGRIPGKPSADFRMAEDAVTPALSDLANPRGATNNRPDHVMHTLFRDNCFPDSSLDASNNSGGLVLLNSVLCRGPFQKAFHLLAAGGSFPSATDRSAGGHTAPTVAVTAVGVPTAVRIVFRANQTQWQVGRNYKHYAVQTVLAAEEIFGVNSSQAQSTLNAFDAVGLLSGRLTNIQVRVVPAGAGTVSALPSVIFPADQLTVTASAAIGRTFVGFVVRFANGDTRDRGPGNPLRELAEPGLIIEARFN